MEHETEIAERLPVSVVVPTLGRLRLLRECLLSLQSCVPQAGEIVVVDGGGGTEMTALAAEFRDLRLRVISDERRGTAAAVNKALKLAAHDIVLLTHDDCIVSPDWVAAGWRLMTSAPDGIVTGRVLPRGDPRLVPGLATDPEPRDLTGTRARVLVAHNMACSRAAVLAMGGFDERLRPVSEDDDLEYRWRRAGGTLRYAPQFTVWHSAWRSPQQMRAVYRGYAEGDGMFYAKHLMERDFRMLAYIARDLLRGAEGEMTALLVLQRRWWDHRLGILAGLPRGFWRGLKVFWPRRL